VHISLLLNDDYFKVILQYYFTYLTLIYRILVFLLRIIMLTIIKLKFHLKNGK